MHIMFSKYQGAGNDFILIKDIDLVFPQENHELIRKLCDRRFGIGADGLMLLRPSVDKDFNMMYFNSDGREGTMCGNGGRCLVAFALDCGYISKEQDIVFDAIDGEHIANIIKPGLVSLKMKDVNTVLKKLNGYMVDTGSIHHVRFVDNIVDIDVYRRGKAVREHSAYAPGGCNVNFIQNDGDGVFSIRTYERGVEDETLACGTGSVASAIVLGYLGDTSNEYLIRARGGNLKVRFEKNNTCFKNIWLEGPATLVFKGVIDA